MILVLRTGDFGNKCKKTAWVPHHPFGLYLIAQTHFLLVLLQSIIDHPLVSNNYSPSITYAPVNGLFSNAEPIFTIADVQGAGVSVCLCIACISI